MDVRLGFSVLQVMAVGYVIILAEAAAHHLPNLRAGREGYGREFGLVLRSGLLVPAHSYVHAVNARARIARRVAGLLEKHDLLAMPTVGALAEAIPPGPRPLARRIRWNAFGRGDAVAWPMPSRRALALAPLPTIVVFP